MGGKGKGKGKAMAEKGKGKGEKGKGEKGKGKGKGKGKEAPMWVKVKPAVLVTGVSGFVAMSVVRRLLDKKYKVRGTIRSLADEQKVGQLKRRFPDLELFEADLLGGSEAFEKAMTGCGYVIHTASPFQLSVEDPQKDLIDPALKGTEAVMTAAVKAGVTRVVLTSSMAACGPPQGWIEDPSTVDKEKVFCEDDWNDTSSLTAGPYRYSKYLAEKKAWEIADGAENLSLAVMLPSFVIGPMMSEHKDAESIKFIKGMLDGTKKADGCKGSAMGVVDVRDLSLAHVVAMESEEAGGKRFVLSSETGYPPIELAGMLRDSFKAYPVPTEGADPPFVPKYNHARAAKILGFKPTPVERSLRDMANAAIRLGIVERKVLLRPAEFWKVADIQPDSKGANLIVKVVSLGASEEGKGGKQVQEVVVGDDSGIATMRLVGDEIAKMEVGKVVEVRNSSVQMLKGYVRLLVGKWGKISPHTGDTAPTPNMEKDISATEYELVVA